MASGMKLWGNLAAVLVLIIGAIWTLQGANLIGGSQMSGQTLWLYVGLAMAVASLGALWWINGRRSGS